MESGGSTESDRQPEWIHHFLIEDVLGEGAFGCVYLALDTKLDRRVAVKVLTESTRSDAAERIQMGIREARINACLDHPNIVPVYETGRTEDGATFIVSKFIRGETLAARMRKKPDFEPDVAVAILAKTAKALQHAHSLGLVHRDVKPSNIMIDGNNQPFLIDFGLALLRENLGRGRLRYVGTPPYMSPEQARGEGHLVTGRSDVFSLGVILYEMLTGAPIVEGATLEVMRTIEFTEFPPPRRDDRPIPPDLERICLLALSPRPGDRPDAAGNDSAFAEELEHFEHRDTNFRPAVVPKGLHSFNEADADFFLDLLPGPRNRSGLPLSVFRWKQRIEATNPAGTFRVGLVYGPSGSGKSSLVRSGLLPHLDSLIVPVFVEASANTEEKLVCVLHHRFPRLDGESDLRSLLRRLREGEGAPSGCKILLIIDQFEQFLHQNRAANDSLIGSLRQCDGVRLQCLIIVRDDFWIGVSKVFATLEIEIDTGRNAAAVDRFDLRHAGNVLVRFGQSYGCLPPDPVEPDRSQRRFVRQAIEEISEDEKVIPVRLALFAEMFKSRPWKPAELQLVGGMSGLEVLFLEDCFGERTGSAAGKPHATAAQGILEAFLPGSTATMKGRSLSRNELREASGLEENQVAFDKLLDLLIKEHRLLQIIQEDDESDEPGYGLAHDYLVPGIRKWINRKKLDTRTGRAELKLREAADRWAVTKHKRLLPTFKEWCQIRLFSNRSGWSPEERELMARAGRRSMVRAFAFSALVAVILAIGWEVNGRLSAPKIFNRIFASKLENLGDFRWEVDRFQRWMFPMLRDLVADENANEMQVLYARMILCRQDQSQKVEIAKFLERVSPDDFGAICRMIRPLNDETQRLLETTIAEESTNEFGFRARAALFLSGSGHDSQDFVEEWLDLDVDRVVYWAKPILEESKEITRVIARISSIPIGPDENRPAEFSIHGKRRAKAALALLKVGVSSKALEILGDIRCSDTRSYLIDFLNPSLLRSSRLWTAFDPEQDPHINAGILQALAKFEMDTVPKSDREAILTTVTGALESKNGSVHLSAEYVLKQWGYRYSPPVRERPDQIGVGEWFTNSVGAPFVVLPEIEGRTIAAMATELTKSAYLEHMPLPDINEIDLTRIPRDDGPILFLTALDIIEYCDILSKLENLEPCYVRDGDTWHARENMQDHSGYRIPTRLEWLHACRGSVPTKFYFGSTSELIHQHAWITANARGTTHGVGRKRPNPFGLFDCFGNAAEWTHRDEELYLPLSGPAFEIWGHSYRTDEDALSHFLPRREIPGKYTQHAGIRLVRTIRAARKEKADEIFP